MDSSSARFDFSPQEEEHFEKLSFTTQQFITKRPKHQSFKDHYARGKLLGTGAFGKVYSCIHMATGLERAAKVVPKSDNKKANKVVKKEFELLAQLDHPNLVKAYEMFENDEEFCIVTDYYQGRDLFDLVHKEGHLREEQVAALMKRLLCCINYCHQNNIVHRDLKLENVLLHGDDFHNLKLIDFGLAKQQKADKPFYEVAGSAAYISPQMTEGEYKRGCDIWALGVISYVLLCGQLPFAAPTDLEVVQRIKNGDLHFNHEAFQNHQCKDFVRELLTYDEDSRPTAADALLHPWLQALTRSEIQLNTNPQEAALLDKEIKSALRSMRRFESGNTKLKAATGALIASQYLRPEQRERIDAVFRALDQGCHGSLCMEDLQSAFAQYLELHGTVEDLQDLIRPIISHSESGVAVVKYSEFAAIFALEGRKNEWVLVAQDLVQGAYTYLDSERKGYITAQDLQNRFSLADLCPTPESSSKIMIAEVTNNRVISKDAFEKAILGKRRSSNQVLLKRLAKSVDQCQAQAEAWSKDMGKFMHTLIGK